MPPAGNRALATNNKLTTTQPDDRTHQIRVVKVLSTISRDTRAIPTTTMTTPRSAGSGRTWRGPPRRPWIRIFGAPGGGDEGAQRLGDRPVPPSGLVWLPPGAVATFRRVPFRTFGTLWFTVGAPIAQA